MFFFTEDTPSEGSEIKGSDQILGACAHTCKLWKMFMNVCANRKPPGCNFLPSPQNWSAPSPGDGRKTARQFSSQLGAIRLFFHKLQDPSPIQWSEWSDLEMTENVFFYIYIFHRTYFIVLHVFEARILL